MKIRDLSPFTPATSSTGSPSTTSVTNVAKLKLSEAGRWPDIVYNLADEFGLDVDLLKRHHVCELYSAGFDKFAEEVRLWKVLFRKFYGII